jgi:ubiquitin-protein ligase
VRVPEVKKPGDVAEDSDMVAGCLRPVSMRFRRLQSDAAQVAGAFRASSLIQVTTPSTDGPPETYRVDYSIAGLAPGPTGDPMARAQHSVEIQLTSDYPRLSPRCKMLTPIFHPNIDPDGTTICIGDHWTAGERLADLIVRIGEMIAYQAYNIRSPLNGEAAMWADLNGSKLPLDARSLHPAELE